MIVFLRPYCYQGLISLKKQSLIESNSERKNSGQGGDGELLFNGYSVSVWDGEQGLEMDDCVTI